MDEKIQAIEQETAITNMRWQVIVVVGCFSMLRALLLWWLPEPWAASLAWVVVCGIYILILYRTKPKFRTHRRGLLRMLTAWIGGAIGYYVSFLQPEHRPLWVSGVFWGVVTLLFVWAYMKRKQNGHVS